MQENLIIIFARNPKLGKVKTRLANTIGDFAALKTYKILMKHTANVVEKSNAEKIVFYSEYIDNNDVWAKIKCKKVKQSEGDLGEKMQTAFEYAFELGHKKIVIIGSDVYSLKTEHIDSAFTQLETHDVVIGPAHDGGYYLLGLNFIIPELFEQKKWGTSSVLENTLADLNELNVTLLEPLNDIDTYEDLKKEPQLLKKINIHD